MEWSFLPKIKLIRHNLDCNQKIKWLKFVGVIEVLIALVPSISKHMPTLFVTGRTG